MATTRATLRTALEIVLLSVLAGTSAGHAHAHGYKRNAIEIVHPWTSEKGEAEGRDAIVAMEIRNTGKVSDRILRAETVIAERAELRDRAGVVVTGGVPIQPGKALEFGRGTVHLRLIGMKKSLVPYDTLPVTLVLEKAGTLKIDVLVEER